MFFDTRPRRRAPLPQLALCHTAGVRPDQPLLRISDVVRLSMIVSDHAYTQAVTLSSVILDGEMQNSTEREKLWCYRDVTNLYWDFLTDEVTEYLRACVSPAINDETVFHLLDAARPWYDWVRRGSLHLLSDDSYGPCVRVTAQAKYDFVRYLRELPQAHAY